MKYQFRGFTIVELLIYMGILSILLVVLSQVFLAVLDVQSESEATTVVEQDFRYLLDRLEYDINRATAITIPSLNGATNDSLRLTIGGVSHTYALTGTDLVLTVGPTDYKLNSFGTEISDVQFTRLGNPGLIENTITASLTITSKAKLKYGRQTVNFKTTIAVRRN